MKVPLLFLLTWLAAFANAATSDILFATGGGSFPGRAGNIVFNGQHFVAPCVQTEGAINLVFLDTNAVAVSNLSLSITGSTPRIALNGSGYLMTWLETNVLKSAAVSTGVLGAVFTGAINVSDETVSLSAAAGKFLTVFHSGNAVFARPLKANGQFTGAVFSVAPSDQPQLYPSVGTDGTNHLVCWMEQNVASNDWRVMVQRVTAGALNGFPVQVSETNSMRPYQTACSFGTNFLVIWSADEGPWLIDPNLNAFWGIGILWRPTVHARMLSETAAPLRHEFSILRNFHYNTNVAVAFGNGRYIVACYNWGGFAGFAGFRQRVQPLSADGARIEYPFDALWWRDMLSALVPSMAFGAGAFCAVYSDNVGSAHSVMLAPQFTPNMQFFDVRRTNNGIITDSSVPGEGFEISTNLIDWQRLDPFSRWLSKMPSYGGRPQLYFRQAHHTWRCIENLRMVDLAKQQWAMDNFKLETDVPAVSDLVGRYLPQMPSCPTPLRDYTLNVVGDKPTCAIAGHSN